MDIVHDCRHDEQKEVGGEGAALSDARMLFFLGGCSEFVLRVEGGFFISVFEYVDDFIKGCSMNFKSHGKLLSKQV